MDDKRVTNPQMNPYDLIAECEDYEMAHDGSVDELCQLARNLLKENRELRERVADLEIELSDLNE